MADPTLPAGSYAPLPAPMLVGLFGGIASLSIPEGIDLVQTSGHTERGKGAARYSVGAATDVPVSETVHSTNTANGRPVRLNEFQATLEMFGAAGDGVADDTVAVNAAAVWSGNLGNQSRPVFAESAAGYAILHCELQFGTQFIGRNRQGTRFLALKSDKESLLTIAPGPIKFVLLQDITIDGGKVNTTADGGTWNQCGAIWQARASATEPTQGGLWYSNFVRFDVIGFAGHDVVDWGGATQPETGGFPNQFNTYTSCNWQNYGANRYCNSYLAVGEVGQILFLGSEADSAVVDGGWNIELSRETALPAGCGLPVVGCSSGEAYSAGAGSTTTPYAIRFLQMTSQGTAANIARGGLYLQGATGIEFHGDMENLGYGFYNENGSLHIQAEGRNVGLNAGAGVVFTTVGGYTRVTGTYSVEGSFDKLVSNGDNGAAYFDVSIQGFLDFHAFNGTTSGMHRQLSVGTNGIAVLGSARYGLFNTSDVPITTFQSFLPPGENITIGVWEYHGHIVLQNSGPTGDNPGMTVPGGRVLLRKGDTATITRGDFPDARWMVSISKGELIGNAGPPLDYIEAGEYCRNIAVPPASGSYTRGWWKITTGDDLADAAHWRNDETMIA